MKEVKTYAIKKKTGSNIIPNTDGTHLSDLSSNFDFSNLKNEVDDLKTQFGEYLKNNKSSNQHTVQCFMDTGYSSNREIMVDDGQPYVTNLICSDKYPTNVTVKMGDQDITEQSIYGSMVYIDSVTDDITINSETGFTDDFYEHVDSVHDQVKFYSYKQQLTDYTLSKDIYTDENSISFMATYNETPIDGEYGLTKLYFINTIDKLNDLDSFTISLYFYISRKTPIHVINLRAKLSSILIDNGSIQYITSEDQYDTINIKNHNQTFQYGLNCVNVSFKSSNIDVYINNKKISLIPSDFNLEQFELLNLLNFGNYNSWVTEFFGYNISEYLDESKIKYLNAFIHMYKISENDYKYQKACNVEQARYYYTGFYNLYYNNIEVNKILQKYITDDKKNDKIILTSYLHGYEEYTDNFTLSILTKNINNISNEYIIDSDFLKLKINDNKFILNINSIETTSKELKITQYSSIIIQISKICVMVWLDSKLVIYLDDSDLENKIDIDYNNPKPLSISYDHNTSLLRMSTELTPFMISIQQNLLKSLSVEDLKITAALSYCKNMGRLDYIQNN